MKTHSPFFKRGLGGFLLLTLSLFISLSSFAQTPKVDTLFNIASPGDNIEYRVVGRNVTNGTLENQSFFSKLDCDDLVLGVGKSMLDGSGGIFPESFGELDNPVTLDSTAVDANDRLMFKKYDEIGAVWNFNIKFVNWNSYYIVYVLDDVGTCTKGKIWRVK